MLLLKWLVSTAWRVEIFHRAASVMNSFKRNSAIYYDGKIFSNWLVAS